jgi:predicted nucleic acid-binding protein
VITIDTSLVVAAFASWHEAHPVARAVMARQPRLVAHCALEAYSVLTRLPSPHRVTGQLAQAFIAEAFPGPPLSLPPEDHSVLLELVAGRGIEGGAVYDAVVTATALHAGATAGEP